MKNLFSFRLPEPSAITLNRKLIIIFAALISVVILCIIISSFNTNHPATSHEQALAQQASHLSPMLDQLPKNYRDNETIKKFTTPTPVIPPEVTQEINNLRSETSYLQTELAELKSPPQPIAAAAPPKEEDSPEARKSAIFFTSGIDSNSNNLTDAKANPSGSSSSSNGNHQQQQNDFLQKTEASDDVYNQYSMITPASPYEVQAGTIIAANLLTAINSSLPGDVVAQVKQNIFDTVNGKYLLIPQGSKLLGKYDSSIAYGQQRILIVFNRILRPDGSSIQLSNFTGSDSQGESGFNANVDNHWGKILGAATISTLLSFGAGVAADRNSGGNTYYPSAQQGAILGVAGNIAQTGQSLAGRAMDIQPTLTIPAGFNFNIIVNKDMVLSPYVIKNI